VCNTAENGLSLHKAASRNGQYYLTCELTVLAADSMYA
jgi:hypothetical protein